MNSRYADYLISAIVVFGAVSIALIIIEFNEQEPKNTNLLEAFCTNEEYAKIESIYREQVCNMH